MSGGPITLSVVQLNAWLLAFPGFAYSKDYAKRRAVLAARLAATGADVLALQEVWRNGDKRRLERELRELGYPHFLYTAHRLGLGDGLFLASKFPLRRVERSRAFRTVTRFVELFPAKRAVAATLEHPAGEIDFYQTHLGSLLFDERKNAYDAGARNKLLVQLLEVAEFIRGHRRADFAVLVGDLNFHYQEHESGQGYRGRYADEYTRFLEALAGTGLRFANSFLAANGMDASHAIAATYSQSNPYASLEFSAKPEETIDYVLHAEHPRWRPRESTVVFREAIAPEIPALSDHYGIRTVFELAP